MTQETHITADHPSPTAAPFPEAELRSLHAEDVGAGKAIICLMGGIFIVGMCLYLFVDWWVS